MKPRKQLTEKQKRELCEKFKHKCAMCKDPLGDDTEYDHDIPLGMEGDNNPGNWQPLCRGCHKVKTRRDKFNMAKLKRLENARLALEFAESGKSSGGRPTFTRPKKKWPSRKIQKPVDPWRKGKREG